MRFGRGPSLHRDRSPSGSGRVIQRSDDGGKTWHQPGTPPGDPTTGPGGMPKGESNKFVYDTSAETGSRSPPTSSSTARSIPGNSSACASRTVALPSRARLCRRRGPALSARKDGAKSWHELAGLRGHGTGPKWQPGAGGMGLHTIILDPSNPARLFIAIFGGGRLPLRRRRHHVEADQPGAQVRVPARADAEVGFCVTTLVIAPARPGVLFHAIDQGGGILRSDNAATCGRRSAGTCPRFPASDRSPCARAGDALRRPGWTRISGFPPEGKLRFIHSRTGGDAWEPLTKGRLRRTVT